MNHREPGEFGEGATVAITSVTPPINSVSDERLAEMLAEASVLKAGRVGMTFADIRDLHSILTELAARRAANTPVREWVYLVHDWEINEPGQRGYSYARTPERAEQLAKNGVKLTPVYTRHPASDFTPASPALPSQVVGVSLADATTALERSLESEGSGINAYLRDDIEQAIAVMRSCLTSPAAEPGEDKLDRLIDFIIGPSVSDADYDADAERDLAIDEGRYTISDELRDLQQSIMQCRTLKDLRAVQITVQHIRTHPAPSASREVTVTDADVQLGIAWLNGSVGSAEPCRLKRAADKILALLAALPEREG